jgi:hypothetical protein
LFGNATSSSSKEANNMGQQFSHVGNRRLHSTQNTTESKPLVASAAHEPISRRTPAAGSDMSQRADLEGYMHATLLEVSGRAPKQIFRPSERFPKPQLRKGVMNRILVFLGSFNPPHVGHKLLLTHVFFRSDLKNIVAAIISLNCTRSVKNKIKDEPDALVLSRKERARLWEDELLTPWSWVDPYKHQSDGDFGNALLDAVESDGSRIEFILVVGGDHIDEAAASNINCNVKDSLEPTVVFSDGLRSVPRGIDGSPLNYLAMGSGKSPRYRIHDSLLC